MTSERSSIGSGSGKDSIYTTTNAARHHGGGPGHSSSDTVGSLLASIATLVAEALRLLSFADKRAWAMDEHEQVRALEDVLDEARKDFQEMGPLVNGQLHYEGDRTRESLDPGEPPEGTRREDLGMLTVVPVG